VRGLRLRFILTLIVTALAPMSIAAFWVQTTVIERQHVEYGERLESAARSARLRWEQRIRDWQRFTNRLCEREPSIETALRHLSAGRFGRAQRRALNERVPTLMGSLSFDELFVIQDSLSEVGTILATSAPEPIDDGEPLLDATRRTGARPFARSAHGSDEALTLTFSCSASYEQARARVVTAVRLDDGRLRSLFGDSSPIDIALVSRDAPSSPETEERRTLRIQTLSDASGSPIADLIASVDDGPLRAQIEELQQGFLGVGAVAALFALIFGLTMAGRVSGPLRDLEAAAARVARGDFEAEIAVRHGGEIGQALDAFNEMTRTLRQTRSRMLRAERIAAWREIARRIAHEIKNPLSPIQVSIETMRKTKAKAHPDFDEIFEESTLAILEEVGRLKHIVLEFSRFARLPRPKLEAVALSDIVNHITHLHAGDPVPLAVVGAIDALPEVRADREQLTQVLLNLVQNAIDAARARHGESGGRVEVRFSEDGDAVGVEVADNGHGISEEERGRVFEPYFTTKSHGTGLGLAIVLRIIEEHQGTIEIVDGIDGGAAFRVELSRGGPAETSVTDTVSETSLS